MPMFVGQIITPSGVLLNVHYNDQFQSSSVIYLRNVSVLMTFIKFYLSGILHNLLLRVRLRTRVVSSRMFFMYVLTDQEWYDFCHVSLSLSYYMSSVPFGPFVGRQMKGGSVRVYKMLLSLVTECRYDLRASRG